MSKNLNETCYRDCTVNGVSFRVNEDNSISLRGRAERSFLVPGSRSRFWLSPGTYHLSGAVRGVARCLLEIYTDESAAIAMAVYSDFGNGRTIRLDRPCCGVVRIGMDKGAKADNLTLRIQLEEGAEKTDYASPWLDGRHKAICDMARAARKEYEAAVVRIEKGDNADGAYYLVKAIERLYECAGMLSDSDGDLTIRPGRWQVHTGPGEDYPITGNVYGGSLLSQIPMDGWRAVRFCGEVRFIKEEAVEV